MDSLKQIISCQFFHKNMKIPSIMRSWRRHLTTDRPPLADINDEVKKTIASHPAITAELLHQLSNDPASFQVACEVRSTIAQQKSGSRSKSRAVDPLDQTLRSWLSKQIESENVSIRRIENKSSSERLISKIIEGDAVRGSDVKSMKELISLENRRCYGLFHKSMPEDPLAFIHVALTNDVANSMSALDTSANPVTPSCAIFYSVNSPHLGLKGLDLGAKMIKAATAAVQSEFDGVSTLSTLSPIPGFLRWLNIAFSTGKIDSLLMTNRSRLTRDVNHIKRDIFDVARDPRILCENKVFDDGLKPTLLWLGSHYLALEKKPHSTLPLDEVARFHLRNGAVLHRLHWGANDSSHFLDASAGMMVNYAYQLDPRVFPASSTTVLLSASPTTSSVSNPASTPSTSNYTVQYDLATKAKYFSENPGRLPLSREVYDLLFKSPIV